MSPTTLERTCLHAASRCPLARLFHQSGVVTRESALEGSGGALHRDEEPLLARCVERRRREIIASRTCARLALAELGITDFPLLAGPDRAPLWPPTIVGSITHTDGCASGYCGVAVADRRLASGLGIDAEPSRDLPPDLWAVVLDESEREAARSSALPGIQARLLFSAKEATYKALFPIFRRFLQFSDVHIDVLPDGAFLSKLSDSSGCQGSCSPLLGRFVIEDDLLVTGVIVRDPGLPLA